MDLGTVQKGVVFSGLLRKAVTKASNSSIWNEIIHPTAAGGTGEDVKAMHENLKDKTILTANEAAKILNVTPNQIREWFDRGEIRGWRTHTTGDIRIPRNRLSSFLNTNGFTLEEFTQYID